MFSKVTIVGLLLVSLNPNFSHCQRSIDPITQQVLEGYLINNFYRTAQSAAAGVAIVKNDGEVLYTTGLGVADASKGIDATNSTQFTIASVSKGVTGIVTAKVLSERFPHLGEAVLDTPIRRLLPNVNITFIDRYRSEHITFRDLLSHRVCVEQDNTHVLSGQLNSTEELIYRARYNQEICTFRMPQSSYNNQMVAMAGYLAGVVANKTYSEVMHDFWDELGMTNTTLVKWTDDAEELPHRAMPHYFKDGSYHVMNYDLTKRLIPAAGSGAITTTPDDMVKFMRMVINDGEVDGKQVIKKEVMEWLRRPLGFGDQMMFKETDEDLILHDYGFSLGMQILGVGGFRWVHHQGMAPPYHTMVTTVPELKIGIFSTTNTGPVLDVDHYGLHFFVLLLLQGVEMGAAEERALQFSRQMRVKQDIELRKFENDKNELAKRFAQLSKGKSIKAEIQGKYGSGMLGEIEIVEKLNEITNQLQYYMEYGVWFRGWLQQDPNENGKYIIIWDTDIIQDRYALNRTAEDYVTIADDLLFFLGPLAVGIFQRGVSLDTLPVIPWESDSC